MCLALGLALLLYAFVFVAGEVAEGEVTGRRPGDPAGAARAGQPRLTRSARRSSRRLPATSTALGSYSVLTLIVAAVALSLLFMRRRAAAAFIVGAVLTGTLLSTSLKALFDRPRPDLTGVVTVFTSSFPSGHATVSAVAYLTLGTCLAEMTDIPRLESVLHRLRGVPYRLIVGLSRVYLGVHYPSDVVAGWAIGTAWALICGSALTLWRQARL